MKKDVKRLWNEMRAADLMYRTATEDKPRLYLRHMASVSRLYARQISEHAQEDPTARNYFSGVLRTIRGQIQGARQMKKLMEENDAD